MTSAYVVCPSDVIRFLFTSTLHPRNSALHGWRLHHSSSAHLLFGICLFVLKLLGAKMNTSYHKEHLLDRATTLAMRALLAVQPKTKFEPASRPDFDSLMEKTTARTV
jgi:hypothetical protein